MILDFLNRSYFRKLLVFTLGSVVVTVLAVFLFQMGMFRAMTEFSLKENGQSLEATVEDFLGKYVTEKADTTWLQLKAAQDNLTVLGKTAQKLVDNQADLAGLDSPGGPALLRTGLEQRHGALSSRASDTFQAYVPPSLAKNPAALKQLGISALLNLSMDAVFEANRNNAFIYFVGNPPVTRAYPNIDLAEVLGDGRDNLFWRDYFAPNVAAWTRWFTDPALGKAIPSPVTVEAPYADAAGQGMMVTMFYPLWDHRTRSFAGAVGADITLAAIIENILSIKVAKTGFAFLMNGKGEIIAMPESGFRFFQVNLKETRQGSLSYYSGSLLGSGSQEIQEMAKTVVASKENGLYKLVRTSGQDSRETFLISWANLPAFSDADYQADQWKIVIQVPENEILEALNKTHQAISNESTRMFWWSIFIVILLLLVVSAASWGFSSRATRDLRSLAKAAEQISAKDYNISLQLHSKDELGTLGRAFGQMSREIRDYTVNLEAMVASRTEDLVKANDEITRLNRALRNENQRLGAELDVARQLQLMVLPKPEETSSIKSLDIACFMRPADEVGGDYYDVLSLGETVFFGIGDVTGHGLSAGVIMLMAQTALLTLSQAGERDMKRILDILNRVLFKNILRIREDKNMTLSVLQYHDGNFTVVGQHETVLVCRKDGSIENIETQDLGLPVGLEEDIGSFIGVANIHLAPGDTMVLYTDGVTEASDTGNRQFGIQGLKTSLGRLHHQKSSVMLDGILAEVYGHIGKGKVYDDISLLVIKQKELQAGG